MGFRDWWSKQSTASKLIIGLAFCGGGLFVGVILMAVVGTFILGIGTGPEPVTPQIEFETTYDEETREVTIQHLGGDSVDASNLVIVVGDDRTESWPADDGEVVAGDETVVEDVDPGTEIRVVWQSEDNSVTLEVFTAE